MQSMDRKAGNFAVREGPIQLNHKLSKVPSFWDLWQADAAEAASSIKKQRQATSPILLAFARPAATQEQYCLVVLCCCASLPDASTA